MKQKRFLTFALSLGVAFIGCMLYLCASASQSAQGVADSVLRFHVIANSDSKVDQELKLKVRDALLAESETLFKNAETKAEAISAATLNKNYLEKIAMEALRRNGCSEEVSVSIENTFFPTKSYESVTFPAGNYDAIRVEIGRAEGENFWCVMFPALCVPSVSEHNEQLLSTVMEREDLELVTKPYTLKFKTAEWLGKLKNWFD